MDDLGAFMRRCDPPIVDDGADPDGALAGVTLAVKDLIDVAGLPTGAGNPDWLADAPVATDHAPVVRALLAAGACIVGKTITDELAYSLAGINDHYGTPRNPSAPGRIPGGSSSGSASAVAGGAADLALGTDTGGSVRTPASYCGLFGMRPTHGRLPLTGVVPLAPSFDTVGLFARSGAELATGWRALSGGPDQVGRPRRLVLAPELFARADPDVQESLQDATIALAERLGLELVEGSWGSPDDLDRWLAAFAIIQPIEAWAAHGEWIRARQPRFGPAIADRFAFAASVDPALAKPARPVMAEVRARLIDLLGDDGVLAQPPTPGPAPLIADAASVRASLLSLTAPAGLAGAPVLVVPAVETERGPVGLAVVGRPGDDDALVALGETV